jgi:hypothetical protein
MTTLSVRCELTIPSLSNKELRSICENVSAIGVFFNRGSWKITFKEEKDAITALEKLKELLVPKGYEVSSVSRSLASSDGATAPITSFARVGDGSGEERINLSKSYVTNLSLGKTESRNYKAAGILCWRRRTNSFNGIEIDILLGLEKRKGEGIVLSVLAGKREYGLKGDIDSADTAVREFWEESGMLFDNDWKERVKEIFRKKTSESATALIANDEADELVSKFSKLSVLSLDQTLQPSFGIKCLWIQRAKMVLYCIEDNVLLQPLLKEDITHLHLQVVQQREEEQKRGIALDQVDIMLGLRWVSLNSLLALDRRGAGVLSCESCNCLNSSLGSSVDGFLSLGTFAMELFCVPANRVRSALESIQKEVSKAAPKMKN